MHSFGYFPTDSVEIDINGVSGKLFKNISTEIAPDLSYIFNFSLETGYFLIVGKCYKKD